MIAIFLVERLIFPYVYFTKYREFCLYVLVIEPLRELSGCPKRFFTHLYLSVCMEVVFVCCLTFSNSTKTLNLMFLGWKGPFGSQLLRINATLVL